MEPRIQYAKTKDGVSIAYATTGQGPPLVVCPFGITQFSLSRKMPTAHAWIERLGKGRLLVQYDLRGTGLSDRDVTDFSLKAHLWDLEAVVRATRIRRFALCGTTMCGPVPIAYAAHHQRQVGQLILYGTFSRAADVATREQSNAIVDLCRSNWEMASQLFGDSSLRGQEPDVGAQWTEVIRAACTGEDAAEIYRQGYEVDVDDLLPQVKAPTLVIHRRGDAIVPFALGQKLAASIPNARFVPLEGTMHDPTLGDTEAILQAIDEFLGEGEEARAKSEPREAGAFRTILFTDVEGSTALTQRLGDTKAREVLREHEHMVREALKAHGGAEVKTMGDGFMVSFSSATKALECAIAMQRAFAEHNETAKEPIQVRVGLNAGEPIAEEDDLFGTAVIVAARIAARAQGGEILAANVVRELTAGKDFLYADRGDVALRGFEDPVRLYEVRWREER